MERRHPKGIRGGLLSEATPDPKAGTNPFGEMVKLTKAARNAV
jgi:hypothetical protein